MRVLVGYFSVGALFFIGLVAFVFIQRFLVRAAFWPTPKQRANGVQDMTSMLLGFEVIFLLVAGAKWGLS